MMGAAFFNGCFLIVALGHLFVFVVAFGFFHRVGFAQGVVCLGHFGQQAVEFAENLCLVLRQILGVYHAIAGTFSSSNQLVELRVQHQKTLVSGPLDEKHHQECDDGGASVDDQLPSFEILKQGPRGRLQQHNSH